MPDVTDTKAIIALAEAATPGPWYSVGPPWNKGAGYVIAGLDDPHVGRIVCDLACQRDDETGDENDARNDWNDAAHIAACSPDTIIALCRELDEARAERDKWKAAAEAHVAFIDRLYMIADGSHENGMWIPGDPELLKRVNESDRARAALTDLDAARAERDAAGDCITMIVKDVAAICGKPPTMPMFIPEQVAALAAERDRLRAALTRCHELFITIRGDWTDPRSACREGWAVIDAALTKTEGAGS